MINNLVYESFNNDNKKYLYHISYNSESVEKLGLLSPRGLLKENPELFKKITYSNYLNRTKLYKKKNSIIIDDIIDFLDNSPKRKPTSADSIFWSFIPGNEMRLIHNANPNYTNYAIDINILKKYSLNSPILVRGKDFKQISWTNLEDNYNEYVKDARMNSNKKTDGLLYKYIVHLAIDCKNIPYNKLIKIN